MSDTSPAPDRSYRPGEWFGIFGLHATVVLPPSEKKRVGALWELVDGGAGFDVVLDALISTGLRDLPGFVLVSTTDGETKVVLRGDAVAMFTADGGEVEVAGGAASTWVERTLTGVTSTTVRLGGAGDEPSSYVLDGGLVRLSRLDEPPYVETAPMADPAAEPIADPADRLGEVAPVPVPLDSDPLSDPLPDPEPLPEVLPDPPTEAFDAPVVEEPVEEPAALEPSPFDEEDDTTAKQPYGGPSDPPSDLPPDLPPPPSEPPSWMPAAPVGPPPPPPPAFPPTPGWGPATPPPPPPGDLIDPPPGLADDLLGGAAEEPSDHDGMTRAGGWEREEFARQHPGIPGQPTPPSVVARPVAVLVFSSGETVDVDRAILVGRAPEARRFTATEQPRLVTVPSPHQEISSTHVEFRPGSGVDHGTAVVTDMGSTNGTVLRQPNLAPEDLTPGIAVQLIPGAVVDLGDGVTIQVTNP